RTPEAERTGGQQEIVEQTARLITVSPQEISRGMSPEDRAKLKSLQDQLKPFDKLKPSPLPVAMGLRDAEGAPPKTFLLERGELSNRAAEVQPGFPIILTANLQAAPARIEPPKPATTGRRTALAQWLTRPEHPLTARVLVNRLWQHHFGRGLVPTAN